MTTRQANRRWFEAAMQPRPSGWTDRLVSLALASIYLWLLIAGVDELGYARDEGFYFHAAGVYQRWLELLVSEPAAALQAVDAHWSVNREHPALIKTSFAISHWLLWDLHPIFSMEGTSYRFPAMVLSALGVGLTYLWGARAGGRLAGAVAAGLLATMPRFFHHSHLACFDAPVVCVWMVCAYAWWRALDRGGWWRAVLVGVTFGLALDTKHNAWFLPIVLFAHAVGVIALTADAERRSVTKRRAMVSGLCLATLGPLTFYALWPWIWHDTLSRLWAYAQFHLGHVYYNMEFLGSNYWQPPMPRAYAPVMTVATVPAVTLVAFSFGLWCMWRRHGPGRLAAWRGRAPRTVARDHATPLLWLLAIIVPYASWLLPTTPIFGGTKHWMTAYPFVALFAGVGVAEICRWARVWGHSAPAVRSWLGTPLLELLMLSGVLIGPAVQAFGARPWGLSAYTPIVGGAPGAATLGLNRGFWGHTTGAPSIVSYLERETPQGGRVYLHDTARSSWDMMMRDGRLRHDLRGVLDMGRSDVALYHHELHMSGVMYQAWGVFGTTAPTAVAGLSGVPVVWVYDETRSVDE